MPTIVTLPLPQQLANNTLADATQVMADLNYIAAQVNANVPAAGKVANSAVSTLLGYLSQVLVAGTGITLTTLNAGGNETLQVTSSAAGVNLAQIYAAACSV